MQNELKYQVRSREIGDLVGMLKNGRLVISPYFQRNLVWRDSHKNDFIDTILRGYPFPQIFIARGKIDLQTMESFTCVVDGQQRLNAIREYVSDRFSVNGRKFSELTTDEKTNFIKYEVPVIDFDLDAGDERLKNVFKRLNRTYYSLSTIERMATEYSSSEFLLTARVLCGDISSSGVAEHEIDALDLVSEEYEPENNSSDINKFLRDPGISEEKWRWLVERASGPFASYLSDEEIFTSYEFQRKVPLMFTLNVMATSLGGYYSRNSKVKEYLEDYNSYFPDSEYLISKLNNISNVIRNLALNKKSMWKTKSNFFSLICEMSFIDSDKIDVNLTREALIEFENSPTRDFIIAAREAVNNKPERTTRGNAVRNLIVLTE